MTNEELKEMCAKMIEDRSQWDSNEDVAFAIRAIQLPINPKPYAWRIQGINSMHNFTVYLLDDMKYWQEAISPKITPLYECPLSVEALEKQVEELQSRIDGRFHNGEIKWHAPGMGEVHSHDHKYEIQCMEEIPETPEGQDQIACSGLADKVCDALNGNEALLLQVEELKESLQWVVYAVDVAGLYQDQMEMADEMKLIRERAK